MKTKTITLKELMKGNKRFCLSPKRAIGRCFECINYGDKKGFSISCESRIVNKKYDDLVKSKKAFLDDYNKKLVDIQEEMNQL